MIIACYPIPEMTSSFLVQKYFRQKKNVMQFHLHDYQETNICKYGRLIDDLESAAEML